MVKIQIEKRCGEAGNHQLNIGYYDRARDALVAVLDILAIKPGDEVLLPAYIGWSAREGSGVFDPIAQKAICPVFYRLNDGLQIEVADTVKKMHAQNAKALLIIHYFGFVDPGCKILVKEAKKLGIPVIEDAAHAMLTHFIGGSCGRYGDYTIYSLHKMLPLESGGMLLANGNNPLPETAGKECQYGNPFHYDLRAIAKQRVKNFNLIADMIGKGTPSIRPLHIKLPGGTIPQTYPILLPWSNRDDVYQDMNNLGWGVVSLYHTMIGAIAPKQFDSTYTVSGQILNLPIHQDIDQTLIPSMLETLVDVVDKRTRKTAPTALAGQADSKK